MTTTTTRNHAMTTTIRHIDQLEVLLRIARSAAVSDNDMTAVVLRSLARQAKIIADDLAPR